MKFVKGGRPPIDAWGVFKVAAERDDAALAQADVRCLGMSGYSIRDILSVREPSFVDGIPPRYLYALLRCSLKQDPTPGAWDSYDHSQQSRDPIYTPEWELAADSFTLQ